MPNKCLNSARASLPAFADTVLAFVTRPLAGVPHINKIVSSLDTDNVTTPTSAQCLHGQSLLSVALWCIVA